jgi:hypothetical protein
MSTLLSWVDFESRTNSTLADPDGRAFADRIADSILAWSARYCKRLGWEYGTYVESFSPGEYLSTFYVSTLPLDPTQSVTVATFNDASDTDDSYTNTVRKNATGTIKTADLLGYGFKAVQISYTGGYSADPLPPDLKQVLTNSHTVEMADAVQKGSQLAPCALCTKAPGMRAPSDAHPPSDAGSGDGRSQRSRSDCGFFSPQR